MKRNLAIVAVLLALASCVGARRDRDVLRDVYQPTIGAAPTSEPLAVSIDKLRTDLQSPTGRAFVARTIPEQGGVLWLSLIVILAVAFNFERLRSWRHGGLWDRALYLLVVALFNVFSLPKKSGFRGSFAFAGESVDRGFSVLVFPEGRRTEDGAMKPFMSGIGLLAAQLRLPVVPIRIHGLFELKKRRQYFSRPGRVTVTFGEPVRYEREEPASITKDLERRVAALI